MLVVYSRWVRIITAKMTRFYITSIVEGWDDITNQMEIYQTSWLNFMTIVGQQRVLLAVFESTEIQSHDATARTPLEDIAPSNQTVRSSKRKPPTAEERGNKKRIRDTSDCTIDTSPVF